MSAATATRKSARLSVNLGEGPALALRELMDRKSITATEAIRRAISVWKFVQDVRDDGKKLAVVDTDAEGKTTYQEVIILD